MSEQVLKLKEDVIVGALKCNVRKGRAGGLTLELLYPAVPEHISDEVLGKLDKKTQSREGVEVEIPITIDLSTL